MDHIASWTSELSRRSVLGVRVFVAAVASVSLLATSTALAAARTPQGTTRIGMFAHPPGPAPFRGRDLPSIRAAEALLGVHIPRPHGSTATDRKAWSVVVDQRNRLVAITYRHDGLFWYSSHGRVQVIVEFRGRFFARTAGYRGWARRQVRARGPVASLVTVNGLPAIFMQGNYGGDCDRPHSVQEGCAPAQHNPCALEMQFGRSFVTLYGPPEWDRTGMIDLAATIA